MKTKKEQKIEVIGSIPNFDDGGIEDINEDDESKKFIFNGTSVYLGECLS